MINIFHCGGAQAGMTRMSAMQEDMKELQEDMMKLEEDMMKMRLVQWRKRG